VNDVAAALESPLLREDGRVLEVPHPARGTIRLLANPVKVPGEAPPARPAPALGADTDAILRDLGYDEARIAALRKSGAI
jgi:crotonobetainyl-CoA:carnitine CoA-transferase CaiB-like acyl-CoA transferase